MIKMLTASTEQLDDAEAAVSEILEQLDIENKLLKNSVGIIACSCEFVEEGVIKSLCGRLPFATVGFTTLANAVNGRYGTELLSISVLTSDDVVFAAACSDAITGENVEASFTEAYARVRAACFDEPALVLAYPPLIQEIGSGVINAQIIKLCGETPVFGALPCESNLNFKRSMVLWNGDAFSRSAAFVMMYGPVDPQFIVTGVQENTIQKQHAIVTEASGCMIKKVNDMCMPDYLATLGFLPADFNSLVTTPFIINHNGETEPQAIGIYSITSQGYAVCGGEIAPGSTIALAGLDYAGVMHTVRIAAQNIAQIKNKSGVLMYPCLIRAVMLGMRIEDEMKVISDMLGDMVPFHQGYAGGEICPLKNSAGQYSNHSHNFSFIACVF